MLGVRVGSSSQILLSRKAPQTAGPSQPQMLGYSRTPQARSQGSIPSPALHKPGMTVHTYSAPPPHGCYLTSDPSSVTQAMGLTELIHGKHTTWSLARDKR